MASVAAVSETSSTATLAGGSAVPKPGARFGWLFAVIWLVYLVNPLSVLVNDATGWRRVVGLAGLAGFLGSWLVGLDEDTRWRWLTDRESGTTTTSNQENEVDG